MADGDLQLGRGEQLGIAQTEPLGAAALQQPGGGPPLGFAAGRFADTGDEDDLEVGFGLCQLRSENVVTLRLAVDRAGRTADVTGSRRADRFSDVA